MGIDLNALKVHLCSLVDEQARSRLASNPTHGKKIDEARDILDQLETPEFAERIKAMSPEQMFHDYPLLATGIGIDGADIEAVARTVWEKAMSDRLPSALVERTRRLARKSINDCKSKDECEAAYRGVSWP